MNFTDHIAGLNRFATQLDGMIAGVFARLTSDIRAGIDPRTALDTAFASYSGRFYEQFSAALSKRMASFVGVAQAAKLSIGGISLSRTLHAVNRGVTSAVLKAIRSHLKGWQSVRGLAMKLYEGYGFNAKEALVPGRDPLPRYLRKAFDKDAAFRKLHAKLSTPELNALLNDPLTGPAISRRYAQAAATRLRTPALRAAYSEALTALQKGKGQDRLDRLLKTAWEEKQRYNAARISQTELHRAWAAQDHKEIMADRELSAVKVTMSATHPRQDICDFHATVDRFGLGPGVYPKAKAPGPPYHPFCRCRLVKKYGIDGPGTLNKEADLAYLRGMPANEAARVMGSRAKLQDALRGKPVLDLVNRKVPDRYQTRPIG